MGSVAAGGTDVAGTVMGFVFLVVLVVLYWLPSIVAFRRRLDSTSQIVLLNFFLGWTVVGWVIALVWAAKPVTAAV